MDKSEYSLLHDQTLTKKNKKKVRSKVTMELARFHDAGYVHGDIRDTNILVDINSLASDYAENVKVHLIDFDWAGKAGEVKYPIGVNIKSVKRPDGVGDGALITKDHDKAMVTTYLFT
jgi:tRNA A-37 threonylcarbamoyl transferase component Bud32